MNKKEKETSKKVGAIVLLGIVIIMAMGWYMQGWIRDIEKREQKLKNDVDEVLVQAYDESCWLKINFLKPSGDMSLGFKFNILNLTVPVGRTVVETDCEKLKTICESIQEQQGNCNWEADNRRCVCWGSVLAENSTPNANL